jgi:hypothetical protein
MELEAATPYPLAREAEKNISTAFSQELNVGAKWKVQRRCRTSQASPSDAYGWRNCRR